MSKIYVDDNVYQATQKRLEYIFNEFDKVIVAFSGGKDSVVSLDIVQRALPHNEFKVLFGDTGMEFPDTYEVVEKTPCHSYQVGQRGKYIFNPVTGKNEYTLVSYGFCLGTKECEECSCEGDKSKCDFY